MKKKTYLIVVILAMALVPLFTSLGASAAPSISSAGAYPAMVSLFGDLSPTSPQDSTLGPGWTTIVVKTNDEASSVTLNLKQLLLDLLPTDIASRVDAAKTTDWNTWLSGLQTTAMTSLGYGYSQLWTYNLSLNSLLSQLPNYIDIDKVFSLILEDLRLGTKTVVATAGTASGNVSLAVVDAQIPLRKGWNVISTPFALDSSYTTRLKITELSGLSADIIDAVLKYDTQTGFGNQAAGSALAPLEAYWIHATADTKMGAIMSRDTTAPPSRSMKKGWNLVGSAPDLVRHLDVTLEGQRGLNRVSEQFTTIAYASGIGYSVAISVGQSVMFTETYKYGETSLGTSYTWSFRQPSWTHLPQEYYYSPAIDSNPQVTGNYYGWVVPFGGYWVFMENDDLLGGFTSTPVSKDLLLKARLAVLGF